MTNWSLRRCFGSVKISFLYILCYKSLMSKKILPHKLFIVFAISISAQIDPKGRKEKIVLNG